MNPSSLKKVSIVSVWAVVLILLSAHVSTAVATNDTLSLLWELVPRNAENSSAYLERVKYQFYLEKDVEVPRFNSTHPHPQLNGESVKLDWSSASRLWGTLMQRYQPFYLFLAFYTFMTVVYWGLVPCLHLD